MQTWKPQSKIDGFRLRQQYIRGILGISPYPSCNDKDLIDRLIKIRLERGYESFYKRANELLFHIKMLFPQKTWRPVTREERWDVEDWRDALIYKIVLGMVLVAGAAAIIQSIILQWF